MKYAKQIEIKLVGNNCIINIPLEQNISSKSLNKLLAQNNNTLTNIDDISLNISCTSEDNMNSKNNFYNYNCEKENKINNDNDIKNYLYSNEKSKLEITYQSIFYSDLKSETSNIKTPLLLLNNKNEVETQKKKDSVVKKLNFDSSNSNNSKNKNINNYNNSNRSNRSNCSNRSNGSNIRMNNISNIQKEILKNINKINTEIQNINIRKLPLVNKNNYAKKISKNLNKEYFIHEKIYTFNKNKNMERIKIDKKIKDKYITNGNKIKSNINISNNHFINNYKNINNEIKNINAHQMTENYLSKIKSNNSFLIRTKNKKIQENNNININNKINNHLLLYKCPSKPNISNMKLKLNNLIKINQKFEKEKEKEKENLNMNIDNCNKENINNNEIEIRKIKLNNNIIFNKKEKEIDNKKYSRQASANSFCTSTTGCKIKSYNSYNHSAKIGKLQKNNLKTNNSNFKTPYIYNKQLILCTPNTNSYSGSTTYSSKNNKSPRNNNNKNFENKSSDLKIENNNIFENIKNHKNEQLLCKVEAHNSLLKNFFLNPNNFKKQEKSEEYPALNNISYKNGSDFKSGNIHLDEFVNNKMSLRKFNTELKIPLEKTKQLGLLTERNINNYYEQPAKCKNNNNLQILFKNNEFDIEFLNSIKK